MPWTRMLFDKEQLISMLRSFDAKIKEPLTIHICGGAACVISHDFRRTTIDVDVVQSDKDLRKFEKEIQAVAREFSAADNTEIWLNQGPKGVKTYLPEDYGKRLKRVDGGFKNLTVKSVSEPDLMIMKLAIRLNSVDGKFRKRDFDDFRELKIDEPGKKLIYRELNKIALANSEHGQKMRAALEALRPDLCFTGKENNLPQLDSIIALVKEKYGLEMQEDVVSFWKQDLASQLTSIQTIRSLINEKLRSKGIDASEFASETRRKNINDNGRDRSF